MADAGNQFRFRLSSASWWDYKTCHIASPSPPCDHVTSTNSRTEKKKNGYSIYRRSAVIDCTYTFSHSKTYIYVQRTVQPQLLLEKCN
ncbi:hypothetical protein FQN60_010632 [Etheostoma spectabile]|uniref:Uncharacterized protein n=1 Tax=Etheostoma spectabile TaxID=54343 RepID=A0A5J5CB83_9PERO|nr:hypothetical protein FQN60_010632 [Etheostoma spectabile]